MQRFLDILISLLALLAMSPILLIVMIILSFSGEKEIFYRQIRVGFGGSNFYLLKFATMVLNSPNIGAGEITLKNDPRVLPFGKFLRKTKLNEIPQIWNILKGDMSVVGPRPMVPNTYELYPHDAKIMINQVKPGLTGIGSIVFRDEENYLRDQDNPIEFYRNYIIPFKASLEKWYVSNQSFTNYLKIILITAWVIIFPKSNIVKNVFKDLPEASKYLNF